MSLVPTTSLHSSRCVLRDSNNPSRISAEGLVFATDKDLIYIPAGIGWQQHSSPFSRPKPRPRVIDAPSANGRARDSSVQLRSEVDRLSRHTRPRGSRPQCRVGKGSVSSCQSGDGAFLHLKLSRRATASDSDVPPAKHTKCLVYQTRVSGCQVGYSSSVLRKLSCSQKGHSQ